MALTFLTPSSINNARAVGVSNSFNAHHHTLSSQNLDQRETLSPATPNLDAFSKCLVERESLSVERQAPRTLRGRPKSPTARRLVCRLVLCLFYLSFSSSIAVRLIAITRTRDSPKLLKLPIRPPLHLSFLESRWLGVWVAFGLLLAMSYHQIDRFFSALYSCGFGRSYF